MIYDNLFISMLFIYTYMKNHYLRDLNGFNLPAPTDEVQNTEPLQKAYVKASAYLTFALEQANIQHNRDINSAEITKTVCSVETCASAQGYLQLCITELKYIESHISDRKMASEIKRAINVLRKRV